MTDVTNARAPSRIVERSLGVLVLLVASLLTATFRPPVDLGIDGSFYLHLAHHVARGHGLVTTLSLYHHGLHPLPAPSTVYPMWPLVLGAAVRVLGMTSAGSLVPKALYVLDTWLVYLVLDFVVRRAKAGSSKRVFPAGVAAFGALLFALNPVLFWCTSLPYSEALAFTFVFLALLAVNRAACATSEREAIVASIVAGVVAALLYLTRFTAILAPLVIAFTLCVTAKGRARWLRPLAALAAAALPMAIEAWHLLRLPHASMAMLIDFAAYRQVPELPPFQFVVRPPTLFGFLEDRLDGVFVAFDPRNENSYYASFGVLAYAPLIATFAACRAPRAVLSRINSGVRTPRYAIVTTALLLGAVLLLPVHATHEMRPFLPWLFGWRHGLPFALIALPALLSLFGSRHRLIRITGAAVGLFAAVHGMRGVLNHVGSRPESAPLLQETAKFLARHPGTTAMAIEPQSLSVHTDAGLYWIACWSPPEIIPTLLEHVPIDYLLLVPHAENCTAFSEFENAFTSRNRSQAVVCSHTRYGRFHEATRRGFRTHCARYHGFRRRTRSGNAETSS